MKKFVAVAATIAALTACNHENGGSDSNSAREEVKITETAPPPGGTWADVVNQTSDGFLMGNPNAKVKLIEIASLGCPFCRNFEEQGGPHVIDLVKGGQLSWEFRPYIIHGAADMAANLVARCNGPKSFFPMMKAMYADQTAWMGRLEQAGNAKLEEAQALPTDQVFKSVATLAGLQDWAAMRGLPQAKADQCLSNQQMIDHEVQVTSNVANDYPDFKGTPSFVLNGTMLADTNKWEQLKPQLEAALK